jgi:glyoxylase-like metal-dependent hydrolase (beta-lactamase superfamily II)
MKQTLVIGALILAGAFPLAAQAPQGRGAAAQDMSTIEIKTNKLASNFYTLDGNGGTIGVLTGPDGVLMVDSQYAQLTDKIVAAIKQVSGERIRFLINTHLHPDHTGGNENFAKMGVAIISRDELRAGLVKNATAARPVAPGTLPLVTYSGSMTFHMNGEDVQLVPIPAAHTSGDTMVRFPNVDVIMTGDFFRSLGYPYFDRANGGTLKGLLDGLNVVIQTAGPNTKIVPGHGAIVDKTAVAAHRDMIIAVRDRVAALMKAGKTQDEIVAAKPTGDYDAKIPGVGTTADRFVTGIVQELTPSK